MESVNESKNVFELPMQFKDINYGVNKYEIDQVYPMSGNVSGVAGVSGSCTGNTQFRVINSDSWWVPGLSYFEMKCRFSVNTGAVDPLKNIPTYADGVAYCDNFVSTLFTTIVSKMDSDTIETINDINVIDTMLTYSQCEKTWLKTTASAACIGEPFTTRVRRICGELDTNTVTAATATAAPNELQEIVVQFRPCLGIFSTPCLSPGPTFYFDFTWNTNAVQNAIESITTRLSQANGGTTGASGFNVSLSIDSFLFYKASIKPDPYVQLPDKGIIELTLTQSNHYNITPASTTFQQQCSLKPTTNKILIGFQDADYVNKTAYGTRGNTKPITSFGVQFSTGSGGTLNPYGALLNQFYISIPELSFQFPRPIYQFATNKTDFSRAYIDFLQNTQGSCRGSENALPFGTYELTAGNRLTYITTDAVGTSLANNGNPDNDQQYSYTVAGAAATILLPPTDSTGIAAGVALTSTTVKTAYNQLAQYGWLGKYPIFAVQIVRPENRPIATMNLTAGFSGPNGGPNNAIVYIVANYSAGFAVEKVGNIYKYKFLDGV